MILLNFLLSIVFLFVLIKCAAYAIRYSSHLARILKFPEFVVSFFIVALISVLPEATISVISAIKGKPELGLGTLLGSNVADLTLVFGIVALFSSTGIKVKSKILGNNFYYLLLLFFPLVLGFDGKFSRIDGVVLVLAGTLFFIRMYIESSRFRKKLNHGKTEPLFKSLFLLTLSLGVLLLSAYLTVKFAVDFVNEIRLPAILVGITVFAFGTCLPELIFSIRAVRENRDSLALGDILGTVVADATIVLGLVALISPFSYNPFNIYVTGTAMFLAGVIVTTFMKTGKVIDKREGIVLIVFYILFIFVEFFIGHLGGLR